MPNPIVLEKPEQISEIDYQSDQRIKLSVTARHGFVAPDGTGLGAFDYKNQEMYIVAVLSQEPKMLEAFSAPETLPLLDAAGNPVFDGNKQVFYDNPAADLHTLTTALCCYPHLFEGQPEHLWVKIAKDESAITVKGKPRDYGKRVNFGIIYLQSAQTMSEQNHVPVSETEGWLKRHQQAYPVFHRWAQEAAGIATARGWIANKRGRIRWVAEDNAKAQGASPARSGVNHLVQSLAADMTKLALLRILDLFEGTKCKLCMLVHDEIVCVLPGRMILNPDKCKINNKGFFVPVYEPDAELAYWAGLVKQEMEAAEAEIFDNLYPGSAGADLSVYWQH